MKIQILNRYPLSRSELRHIAGAGVDGQHYFELGAPRGRSPGHRVPPRHAFINVRRTDPVAAQPGRRQLQEDAGPDAQSGPRAGG